MSERTVLGLSLRQHIGGRWAISWQAYVLNLPLNLLAVATLITSAPTAGQWRGWGVVALLGVAAIGVGFVLADATILRHRRQRPLPIPVVIAVGAAIGALRGIVVVAGIAGLSLQPMTFSMGAVRIAAGALMGAVALPLGALLLSCIDRYLTERRRLLEELAQAERRRLRRVGELDYLRTTVVDGVRLDLQAALSSLTDTDPTPEQVSEAVRSASRRIWTPPPSRRDRNRVERPAVLWSVIRRRPLPATAITLIWGASAVPTILTTIGGWRAALSIVLSVLVLWTSLEGANRWWRRHPAHWGRAALTMTLVAYVLVSPVMWVVLDPRPLVDALPVLLLNFVWLGFIVLATTLVAGAVSSGEEILTRLHLDIDDADVRSRALDAERDDLLRQIAAEVHGSVNSPLVGRLTMGAPRGSGQDVDELKEFVGRLVHQMDLKDAPASVDDLLKAVMRPWTGLLAVRGRTEADVAQWELDPTDARTLQQIVEEGVANAFRHGAATEVEIRMQAQSHAHGRAIWILIDDNGHAESGHRSSAGLGTRLLDAAAPDDWTLGPGPAGGMRLSVVVPVGQGAI